MALTKLTADLDNIQALSDKPNEIEGLTADQLKEKFDKGANDIKDYINDTLIDELDIAYSGLLNFFYPVGTIYETTSTDLDTTTKMANHFGGTWEEYGSGRVLVAKSADTEFDTIGETGGDKAVTLTAAQSGLPAHKHIVDYNTFYKYTSGTLDASLATPNAGSATTTTRNTTAANASESHNNLPPYIVVYRYRRVS
jgi:hypothetical protein